MSHLLETAVPYSHKLLAEVLEMGDYAIDATVGNGFDTLFISELVGKTGHVYGFDIQVDALAVTKQKLYEQALDQQVSLHLQGHETLAEVVPTDQPIKAAIFNLGYLPKGDKTIITTGKTTIQAVTSILPQLVVGGIFNF